MTFEIQVPQSVSTLKAWTLPRDKQRSTCDFIGCGIKADEQQTELIWDASRLLLVPVARLHHSLSSKHPSSQMCTFWHNPAWWQSKAAVFIFNLSCKSVNMIISQSPDTESQRKRERQCAADFISHGQINTLIILSSDYWNIMTSDTFLRQKVQHTSL